MHESRVKEICIRYFRNNFFRRNLLSLLSVMIVICLWACSSHAPTENSQLPGLAIRMHFAEWTTWPGSGFYALAKNTASNSLTHIDILVTNANDTLVHSRINLDPEQSEFSVALEVPPGDNRKIIVEAWDGGDESRETGPSLQFRGVTPGVRIEPFVEQVVDVSLYPIPIPGQSVVTIAGIGSGIPGSTRNLLPISFVSADSVAGIQFDLHFDASIISPLNLIPDQRLESANVEGSVVEGEGGTILRVLIFDQTNRKLPALIDPTEILQIEFQVADEAQPGNFSIISLADVKVADKDGNGLQVLSVDGGFSVTAGGG